MAEAVTTKTPDAGALKRAPADRRRGKRRGTLLRIFNPIEPRTYMIIALLSFIVLFFGWWLAAELDLAKDIFSRQARSMSGTGASSWSRTGPSGMTPR